MLCDSAEKDLLMGKGVSDRTACVKAQRSTNSGSFRWGEDGAFALVGKKKRVLGTPGSSSDVGLIWQDSSERFWHWEWTQELSLK